MTTLWPCARHRSIKGEEHFVPPFRTVDVAGSELGREAIAARVEDEERAIADGLEVAVVGGLLLRLVDWALGAVDRASPPSSVIGS